MRFNVAIVGAGAWSQNHLTGWRAQPDVDITWVVRRTEAKAKERAALWGVPNWSADYRQVLERDDVHVVDILLPHDLHAEVTCQALAAGKHVVLEKPLGSTLPEAKRIVEAARLHRRKIMISENWVYSTMVRKARGLLESGGIGTPFMIQSSHDMDARPGFVGHDWRYSQACMGGGALLDAGTHDISACRFLMGEIRDVAAFMGNHGFREITPMEDTCLVLMRFESGASGSLALTYVGQRERPRSEFTILADKGTIEFDTRLRQFFLTRDKRRAEEFDFQASRRFVEQMAHFIECLREDRTPLTSPEEQIDSLRDILAAYRSVESGRIVRVADMDR